MLSFEVQYEKSKQALVAQLATRPLWYLTAAGAQQTAEQPEIIGVLHSQTGQFYKCQDLDTFFKAHPFVAIWQQGKKQDLVLHTATQLIWSNSKSHKQVDLNDAKKILKEHEQLGLSGWRLPTKDQLYKFATAANNPYRIGQKFRLKIRDNSGAHYWLCASGRVDVGDGGWGVSAPGKGHILSRHQYLAGNSAAQVLVKLLEQDWQIKSFDGKSELAPELIDLLNPLSDLSKLGFDLIPAKENQDIQPIRPASYPSLDGLPELDYRACRLPKMEASRLSDPERGLWELWGCSKEFLREHGLEARDPMLDVQHRAVAIDFGTSSTVVATENQHGDSELLRIGVRDFYQEREPHHYENPTVLEFLDFGSFTRAWGEHAYRPELSWDWVRASHEAQASFRDNPGDTDILASIMPRLKQWALRDEKHQRVRLTGRKGKEIELEPHSERNPVRGQPLNVSEEDPLDPVELYAWYLGMAINWRERGIFLKYYLSFPVKYPLEVRNRILASFRRGLQRSFPQTLIDHHPQVLQQFEVQDLASEPAAYAAAALPFLGVEPTDEGVPYAVFDFGGGTSDFDFGIWRWATDEEDAQGYESVFEHYASSGDNFLGGENLLEHLVYETFKHNLSVLRENKIQFTKPMDALGFPGSEPFLAPTQAAQTNVVMLSAKLRPFLESAAPELAPQLKLDLINSAGKKATCELALDAVALDELLKQKIYTGLKSFLYELKKMLPEFPAASEIQLLLAGNGSRSRHVEALFVEHSNGENGNSSAWGELCHEVFAGAVPEIKINSPLPVDMQNPYAPTSKTGVALGLLQVVPGKNIKLTNRLHKERDGQAPFTWYVGRMRRNQLEPVLTPDSSYKQWQEVGPIQQGVFYLYYSNSPRTTQGLKKGDPELKMQRLDLHEASLGDSLYIRAIGPSQIELVSASEQPAVDLLGSKILVLE